MTLHIPCFEIPVWGVVTIGAVAYLAVAVIVGWVNLLIGRLYDGYWDHYTLAAKRIV